MSLKYINNPSHVLITSLLGCYRSNVLVIFRALNFSNYITPFIDIANAVVYPDGRGCTTIQWERRKTHYLPTHLSEQLPSFSPSLDWKKVKIDMVDCANVSPVIGQLLTRLPGRDIPINPFYSISRATGLPTLPNSIIAVDPATMDGTSQSAVFFCTKLKHIS